MRELSKQVDSIIFDLDGTLWDPIDTCLLAWKAIIKDSAFIVKEVTKSDLEGVFGMQHDLIGKKLFPYLSSNKINNLMDRCYRNENLTLSKQGGILYNNLEEVLKDLYKKFNLYIVSNCQSGYIEAFYQYHGLQKYFLDEECSGNTGESKSFNIERIIKRNRISKPVYIGDTQGDYDATKSNNIPFIFAKYGFGNVESPVYKIDSFDELRTLLYYK